MTNINKTYVKYFCELREIRLEKLKDPRLSKQEVTALKYSLKKVEELIVKHSAAYNKHEDQVKSNYLRKQPDGFCEVKQGQ
jgi:hypothetical protein